MPVFKRLGWNTLEAIMTTEHCQVVRRVGERDNCRLQIPGPAGGKVNAYLKRHHSRLLVCWLWARLAGRRLVAPGVAEANAVGSCQASGVPTMSVIAAGQGRQSPSWRWQSFFLSEEIPAGQPADELWKRRLGRTTDGLATPAERNAFLDALAQTARAFHAAGWCHRDFYWCHFFVREPQPGRFVAHLIDLQRARRLGLLRWRWLLKDLAQFRFSVPDELVTPQETRHWLRSYRGSGNNGWHDWLWEKAIDMRAAFYRWKESRR